MHWVSVSVPFTSGSSLQLATRQAVLDRDLVSVPFTSGSSLQRRHHCTDCRSGCGVSVPFTSGSSLQLTAGNVETPLGMFQFPLHRDPRCNREVENVYVLKCCFSSLYIGILAATMWAVIIVILKNCFSSLYIGILAATQIPVIIVRNRLGFSSLYIGILAATCSCLVSLASALSVSVPFTSVSSLQPIKSSYTSGSYPLFQFPLHRDPRCN